MLKFCSDGSLDEGICPVTGSINDYISCTCPRIIVQPHWTADQDVFNLWCMTYVCMSHVLHEHMSKFNYKDSLTRNGNCHAKCSQDVVKSKYLDILFCGTLLYFLSWSKPPQIKFQKYLLETYWGSTFAVASSRTKILLFLIIARARHTNCRWPALKLLPPSFTKKFKPLTDSFNSTCNYRKHDKYFNVKIGIDLWM